MAFAQPSTVEARRQPGDIVHHDKDLRLTMKIVANFSPLRLCYESLLMIDTV